MAAKCKNTDLVCLGAIAGAFGVRGEVRLKPFPSQAEDIAAYGVLMTEDNHRQFQISLTRSVKGGIAARLSGVRNRDEAEALKGTRLYVHRTQLPSLDEEEFYYTDLIGMQVENISGEILGKVKAVQNYGAGDVLEILLQDRRSPVLIPFTREVVPHIDLKFRRVVVDVPVGLLDENEEAPA